MICPKCRTENPENNKFCRKCGEKLPCLCPKCGAPVLPDDGFCGKCGYPLSAPATLANSAPTPQVPLPLDPIAKLKRYLPTGLAEKILAQRDRIEGEKRQVTVLFCDLAGYTPLTEKLGPEEAYALMDRIYEILIHKVHDFEGTVNEMTGDGILGLFGAPIALEDAPQRAIRSALAIHWEMARLSERMRQEKGEFPPVKMRVGIHTGLVVVGTLGNDLRVEFKAVGDTVNLAARMEQMAEPGTTYVTEDTFKLTEGYFRFEALGEKEVKGKGKPLKIYQVIALSSRRTRFDVSAERGLTPFVGRQRELEPLLDGFERSREGRGQAISIISEAGIGKSRLLYEFRKAVTNEDIIFLEGRCLSYGRNVAYHPIVDILKANFEIQDNDTGQQIREKVTSFLKIIKVDEPSTLPYLLELLSVKESGIEKMQMSPEARKDRTLEALKRIILKGSELRPLIMAVEDLHWMDRSSEDAFKQLLESISGSRVFLIFTYRPEFVHTWGSRSYHSQVTLNRLSNRESLAMVSHLLNTTNVDKAIEDLALSKAEGIPFFIEEFIKSLRELKVIEKSNGKYKLRRDLKAIAIPSTIQDVIMARVDHLPEGAREVLRTGSIIEREFSHELILKVTGLPEQELLSHLSTLRDAELLYERGIYPNSTYIFKHALTKEVVYDSILTKKRKQIHAKIARTIEEIFGDNICDCYGVLTNHCIACEDYEKGAEYARFEARKYQKAASFRDAIEYAKRSILCLEKLPQDEAVQKRVIDARVMLSMYYMNLNNHIEAKEVVKPVIDLAQNLNYQKRLPGIYTAVGIYYCWVEEDFVKGAQYLKDVFEISAKIGDFLALWFANQLLGSAILNNHQFDESITYLKTALDLSLLAKNLTGIAFPKSALALNYNFQGKTNLALQMSKEALESATESGDIFALQPACTSHGLSYYYKGVFPEAEKYLLEGLAYYEKANISAWGILASGYLGFTYGDMKEYKMAEEYLKKCIFAAEDARIFPSWLNVFKLFLAKAKILNHQSAVDMHELNSLVAAHEKNRLAVCESYGARGIGELFLHIDDHHMAEAEAWIRRAIEANTGYGTKWNLARDHSLYAGWFRKKGDIQGAKEQLTKAIDIFRECGADGWVEKTEKTHSELL